jgi:hypothetical protein
MIQPSSNSNTPSIASSTTALADSGGRRIAWNIQNLGQNILYVLLGAGASSTVFHVALKAATSNDDGTGGTVGQESGVIFTGVISVAGTSPRYTVLEQIN